MDLFDETASKIAQYAELCRNGNTIYSAFLLTSHLFSVLQQLKGSPLEVLMTLTLFTGMREGELMELKWDCVDFARGTITINKQLQYYRDKSGYQLVPTKNSKGRVIVPAAFVMALLKKHRAVQLQARLLAGEAWEDSGFVFTNELGHHLKSWTVYRAFKRAVTAIGRPDARFHDLRHSYAVATIRSGDDLKTVQGNLGHATAAFILDIYGHVTDQMKQASATRMEQYIKGVPTLENTSPKTAKNPAALRAAGLLRAFDG